MTCSFDHESGPIDRAAAIGRPSALAWATAPPRCRHAPTGAAAAPATLGGCPAFPRRRSRTPISTGVVVVVLTLLLGIQPVTTDLYLPALPTLQRELGASVAAAQATLSTLIISFGLGQLLVGPLADRFGRRPVLLVGLALYTAAAIGGALADEIGALIAWRALQGVALAAAVTCGRSIVRDLYDAHDGARVMSRGMTGLGFIAVASPVCGGLIVERFGWHAALVALAVFGAITLATIAFALPETNAMRNLGATRPMQIVRNWSAVAGDPTFRAWAALSGCTFGGLYCMLAGSSFVFIGVLGVGRAAFGAILGSFSIAYICGTVLCRRLLHDHGLRGAVRIGAWFSLAGGVGMAALSVAGVHSVWAILLPQYLYAIGHGIHQPCGQAGAIGPVPREGRHRGVALGIRDDRNRVRRRPLARQESRRHRLSADAFDRRVQRRRRARRLDARAAARRAGRRRAARRAAGVTAPSADARTAMDAHPVDTVLCIAGPTASGKSAAALAVAAALAPERRVEIVSVDSALVYRGMDIGTAKPSRAERAAVAHHLIDIVEPGERYSAARFVADACAAIAAIRARGALPILVGGTMLYFKALFDGLDALPEADPELREELDARAARAGWPALHAELAAIDPASAARIAPHDSQRIQRALEVHRLSGRPLSTLAQRAGGTNAAARLARAGRPRLAARTHRRALRGDARRGLRRRGAALARARRPARRRCLRCARSATARRGTRSRSATSIRSPRA